MMNLSPIREVCHMANSTERGAPRFRSRRGQSPDYPAIWITTCTSKGGRLRIGLRPPALSAIGNPSRIYIVCDHAGMWICPTEDDDLGNKIHSLPDKTWAEASSSPWLRQYYAAGLNFPLRAWLPVKVVDGRLFVSSDIKNGILSRQL